LEGLALFTGNKRNIILYLAEFVVNGLNPEAIAIYVKFVGTPIPTVTTVEIFILMMSYNMMKLGMVFVKIVALKAMSESVKAVVIGNTT